MQVTVEYTAQIKRAAGTGREEFTIDEGTVPQTLLSEIVRQHDDLKQLLVTDSGAPQPTLLLFVNEQQTRWDSDAALNDGANVTLMSPISGG